MASVEATRSLGALTAALCRPVRCDGCRARALNPLGKQDARPFDAIGRAEFAITGFPPLKFSTDSPLTRKQANAEDSRNPLRFYPTMFSGRRDKSPSPCPSSSDPRQGHRGSIADYSSKNKGRASREILIRASRREASKHASSSLR